jgi:hypothetical protein
VNRDGWIAVLGSFCAGHAAASLFPNASDWVSALAGLTALSLALAARAAQVNLGSPPPEEVEHA